jgi:serine/threonine-protein kinase
MMGTLAYMPPEQAEGKIDLMDARTDIYSLGAILYEILVNDAPIPRGRMEQMIDYIVNEPIKPPIGIDSSTSHQLNAIAMKALSKRREDRFASALDLAQDVEDYLAGEPVSACPEPWYDQARRRARRQQKQIAGTVAAIVFLVLVQFAWSLRSENQQMAAVERARFDVATFKQLADEPHYFAATSNRLDKNTPYQASVR